MTFKPKNFDNMLEQDVREDIITPLLHRLGYEKDSENDIRRGQYLILRYPKESFGTRKSADRLLTGYADYILDVGKQIRWVLETKSPANGILDVDVDQAFTYAKHPEVNAVFYCLCDGRELRIYQTNLLPEAALSFSLKYEEFESKYQTIENILSPNAMQRDWNGVRIDTGKPLAPNLRSTARISGGFYRYTSIKPRNELLSQFNFQIISGVIERDDQERLVGMVNTRSPIEDAQIISERIGTDKIDFVSKGSLISTDPSFPTIFKSESDFVFPKGISILNYTYPCDIAYRTETVLQGYLDDSVFKGTFNVQWTTDFRGGSFETDGIFEIHII
jgi:Type I restriction enzyme R protein N terminus (HSDR_N)